MFLRVLTDKMSDHYKAKTTFVCRHEKFQFEVMRFVLKNHPSSFQRTTDDLLAPLLFVRLNLDVVVIF